MFPIYDTRNVNEVISTLRYGIAVMIKRIDDEVTSKIICYESEYIDREKCKAYRDQDFDKLAQLAVRKYNLLFEEAKGGGLEFVKVSTLMPLPSRKITFCINFEAKFMLTPLPSRKIPLTPLLWWVLCPVGVLLVFVLEVLWVLGPTLHLKEGAEKVLTSGPTEVKTKAQGGSTVLFVNKPVGRRECQLATFDLAYIAFYYNQKLLVYKGSGTESDFDQDRVERLKDGLREVLGEFYQLAGKLGKDEDGVLRVEYDDEMDGVEVAVATVEQIEIGDLVVEESASKLKDLVPYNGVVNVEGLHRPLLTVQVILHEFMSY
ncbi:hypothetical protein C3L33_03246, partial [Rhododendron williamsianum]